SALGWTMSALSTSGLPVWTDITTVKSTVPLPVLIIPALIGGSALSTAGGIKLARIVILIRRAGQEFARLGYRHSIVALRFRDRHQKQRAVIGVWVYLIAYLAAASAIFVALSFQGGGFNAAMLDSIGAISNSGWLVDTEAEGFDSRNMVLIFAMIIGRLEIIALLPALRPQFWSK
ncbi:MAG: potassium transporter TrkG, partial [Pseudomonadota bacterium]